MSEKRKTKIPPQSHTLDQTKDRSLGYALFQSQTSFYITPNDKFVILPGPRGFGWIMKIFPGHPEEEL